MVEDVDLEVDRLPGLCDRREHLREDRVSVLEQPGLVARNHLGPQPVERAPELGAVDAVGGIELIDGLLFRENVGAPRGGAERERKKGSPALRERAARARCVPEGSGVIAASVNTRNCGGAGSDNSRTNASIQYKPFYINSCRQPGAGQPIAISFGEQRNLSTSSFRPPGGPTPSRGLFYPGDSETGQSATAPSHDSKPGPARTPMVGSRRCACSPETSAEPRPRSRRSRSEPGAAGSCASSAIRAPTTRRSKPSSRSFWLGKTPAGGRRIRRRGPRPRREIANHEPALAPRRAALSREIGIRRVALVNDFGANALGLRYLRAAQVSTLWRGRPEAGGPVAILGAGTGLGQAGVLPDGPHDVVVAAEAGHVDFGPRTAMEDRLVDFLRRRFGRVTRERILSGSGLELVYEFLAADGAARPGRAVTAELATAEDRAAVISRLGLSGGTPCSRRARSVRLDLRLGGWQPGAAVPRDRWGLRRRRHRAEDPACAAEPRIPEVVSRKAPDGRAARSHSGARGAGLSAGALRRRGRGLQDRDRDDFGSAKGNDPADLR